MVGFFFSCPVCFLTENPDTKHRGNIIFTEDSCSYQCFNCKFKWNYHLGQFMSKNMILFLKNCISENELNNLRSMIQEYNDSNSNNTSESKPIIKKREIRTIPSNYKSIKDSLLKGEKNPSFINVINYLNERNPRLIGWADLMWAENQYNFLIPDYEYGNVVGYSLRKLTNKTDSKYIHFIPQGYIFNYDNLLKDRKYEIVCEGQTDALAINGVSILSNIFTPDRLKRILPFTKDKEIILLPDRDNSGKKMVKQLLENDLPFSVAFPNWIKGIKDAEDAVKKYGRLYTIYSILTSKESNKDLIKMKSMKWFNI